MALTNVDNDDNKTLQRQSWSHVFRNKIITIMLITLQQMKQRRSEYNHAREHNNSPLYYHQEKLSEALFFVIIIIISHFNSTIVWKEWEKKRRNTHMLCIREQCILISTTYYPYLCPSYKIDIRTHHQHRPNNSR